MHARRPCPSPRGPRTRAGETRGVWHGAVGRPLVSPTQWPAAPSNPLASGPPCALSPPAAAVRKGALRFGTVAGACLCEEPGGWMPAGPDGHPPRRPAPLVDQGTEAVASREVPAHVVWTSAVTPGRVSGGETGGVYGCGSCRGDRPGHQRPVHRKLGHPGSFTAVRGDPPPRAHGRHPGSGLPCGLWREGHPGCQGMRCHSATQ